MWPSTGVTPCVHGPGDLPPSLQIGPLYSQGSGESGAQSSWCVPSGGLSSCCGVRNQLLSLPEALESLGSKSPSTCRVNNNSHVSLTGATSHCCAMLHLILVAVTNAWQGSFKKEGLVLVHRGRLHSITMGKAWRLEQKVAGLVVSVVRKQRDECRCLVPFLLFI